jgi:hypothetical protein
MGQNGRRKKLEADSWRKEKKIHFLLVYVEKEKGTAVAAAAHTHPQEISVVWDMITKRNDTTTDEREREKIKGFSSPIFLRQLPPFHTATHTSSISPPAFIFHPGEYNQ